MKPSSSTNAPSASVTSVVAPLPSAHFTTPTEPLTIT